MTISWRLGWASPWEVLEGSQGKEQAAGSYTLPSLWGWGNAALLVSNWFIETPQASK